jgi:hypothetical protein
MTNLSDLERLEFNAVDLMARPDCTPARFNALRSTLTKIRALKKQYLLQHPALLRKVHTAPLDRDRPNAKNPDDALAADALIFRAPQDLVGLTIHTVAGAIHVPASGIVETAAHHTDLHRELIGRGFEKLYSIDRYGKSATSADLAQMFAPAALQPIGGNLLKALANRAENASATPSETRQENFDGPQPAATYARSCAAFRARYFGREE